MLVAGGSTNVTTYFAMRLTADGKAATGLTITDFDLQYVRSGVAPVAKVDATALAATDSAHADNKAIEIDSTDQPGLYRVDWPDAAFAAGVREVVLTVKVATAFTEHLRVEIDAEVTAEALGTQAKADVNAEADTALSDYDPPTNAEMEARTLVAAGYFDPAADVVATVTTLTGHTGQTGDTFALADGAAGFVAIDAKTTNLPSDPADQSLIIAATDANLAAIGALNDISVADVLTTQMAESYAANGVAPTLAQAQFAIHQMLMQFGIAGTSLTVRKLNNTTTAFVVTLDDATNPTDAKRV